MKKGLQTHTRDYKDVQGLSWSKGDSWDQVKIDWWTAVPVVLAFIMSSVALGFGIAGFVIGKELQPDMEHAIKNYTLTQTEFTSLGVVVSGKADTITIHPNCVLSASKSMSIYGNNIKTTLQTLGTDTALATSATDKSCGGTGTPCSANQKDCKWSSMWSSTNHYITNTFAPDAFTGCVDAIAASIGGGATVAATDAFMNVQPAAGLSTPSPTGSAITANLYATTTAKLPTATVSQFSFDFTDNHYIVSGGSNYQVQSATASCQSASGVWTACLVIKDAAGSIHEMCGY